MAQVSVRPRRVAGLKANLSSSLCLHEVAMYNNFCSSLDSHTILDQEQYTGPSTEELHVYDPSNAYDVETPSTTASFCDSDTIYAHSIYEPTTQHSIDLDRSTYPEGGQSITFPSDQEHELSGMARLSWDFSRLSSSSTYSSLITHDDHLADLDCYHASDSAWGIFGTGDELVYDVALPQDRLAGPYEGLHETTHGFPVDHFAPELKSSLPPSPVGLDGAHSCHGSNESPGSHQQLRTKSDPEEAFSFLEFDHDYLSSIDGGNIFFPGDESVFNGELSPSTVYESAISSRTDSRSKVTCLHSGCRAKFSNLADRKRHIKTIHEAGESYRCAFNGCAKAYKLWTRLDSFRNHAKSHRPSNLEALVRMSRTDRHGLPVSVITQGSGLSKSRTCYLATC